MKMVKRIVVGLVILIVVIVIGAWLFIDTLVKTGVEKGGTYALGVDTSLDKASLSLVRGTLSLKGLDVANPEGYGQESFLTNEVVALGVVRSSLLGDTVRLTNFTLDGMVIRIEQPLAKKSNVSVIMDHVQKLGGPAEEGPKKEGAPGKKIAVDKVVITNITAYVHVQPLQPVMVKIDRLPLENFSSDEGLPVGRLVADLLPPILMAVVKQAGGALPPGTLDGIAGDVTSAAKALGGRATELLNQSVQEIGKSLEGVGKGLDDTGKGLKEGLEGILKKKEGAETPEGEKKGIGEGLKDLFKKKDDTGN